MKELHPIGWYASRIAPHLPREAFKPVPSRLWGGLAYLVTGTAGILAIGLNDLPLLANMLLSVVIGMSFGGLGFLGHEILHGTVVKNAALRDFLGAIAFWQFSLGPKLWRKWHNMEHHANTQDHDHDPDAWATMEELYTRPAMRWAYRLPRWVRTTANFTSFALFFSIHSFLMFKRYVGQFKSRDRVIVVLQLVMPYAFWFTLLALMGPYKWVFAYVLPLMMANAMVIGYIATNHQLNPLTDVNDPLANSLSVTVPRWVDVLHLNFSYHTEHHVFPGMNPKWAPLVKAQIKRLWPDLYFEMPMTRALRTLAATPRLYGLNHVDLVDPQLSLAYGTLGHGLDHENVTPRPTKLYAGTEAESATNLSLHPLQQGD